jgi:outer membrane protein assembly factor BamB
MIRSTAVLWAVSCLLSNLLPGADWPQWRGPNRTDVSSETGLLQEWPKTGPRRVWLFTDAGLGYSGFAIVEGRLYTLGARKGAEQLLALDAAAGKELWAADAGPMLDNNWGNGPRGTPAVEGGRVYALSARGHLICAQAADGKVLWKKTMEEFGGQVPDWGYTESVLVDGDKVVCTPGGSRGAILALNKMTGEPVWQSKEFKDGAQYASLIAADHNGARQLIQLTQKSVVGVDAKDGKLLWRTDWSGRTAVIPTPIFQDGHVYVTSGYGAGCKLVKIGKDNALKQVYANKLMKNHHGGVILLGEHVYGFSDDVGWACQDFKTGELVWSEKGKLGKGAIGCAGNRLYLLEESSGDVVLIDASPKGWKEHGRFRLEPQTKLRKPSGRIWTHPVISNGRLYLRDQEILYCYDVRENDSKN